MKIYTIKRFYYPMLLFFALGACKKEAELTDRVENPYTETDTTDSVTTTGEATAVGSPIGQSITKTIGPDGGNLETTDKAFRITIPAGGFSTATPVTIQPVTNKAPNGVDSVAYRILTNLEIKKPATITIKLTRNQYSANGGIRLAYQNGEKIWMVNSEAVQDPENHTVSATIEKIKNLDLSYIATAKLNMVISPLDNTILPLQPIRLQVWSLPEIQLKNYPAGTWVPVKGPRILKEEKDGVMNWYVNDKSGGDAELGTISYAAYGESKYSGDYGAPMYLPSKNPVSLSVDVKTKKGLIVLKQDVKIVQDNHISSALGTTSATNAVFVVSSPSLNITICDNVNQDDPSDFSQGVNIQVDKGFTGANGSYRFSFNENCKATLSDNIKRKAVGSTTWIDRNGIKRYSNGELIITSYKKSETNPGFAVIEGTISGTAYFIKEIGVYESEPFTVSFKCAGNGM